MKSKIESYNEKAQVLLGESILSVAYCEMAFGEPKYDLDDYHSVDHGVQFQMESGKHFYFMWSSQYQNHDLKFGIGLIINQFPIDYPPPMRPMSNHQKWLSFLGKKITNITSFWPYVEYQNSPAKVRFPQDWLLEFEGNESLILSAVEIDEDGSTVPMADNVTVFFDIETAKKYDVCNEID